MNERILKLAINCATQKDWDNPAVDPTEYTFSPSDVEKFAKLIVRECINVCRCRVVVDSDYNKGRTDCQSEIKEHFGVE